MSRIFSDDPMSQKILVNSIYIEYLQFLISCKCGDRSLPNLLQDDSIQILYLSFLMVASLFHHLFFSGDSIYLINIPSRFLVPLTLNTSW